MSKSQEFFIDGNVGGYYDDYGHFIAYEEYDGLTDADVDRYAVQVQNGEGYYNSQGRYVPFPHYYD